MADVSTQLPSNVSYDNCIGAKYKDYPTAYNFMRVIIEEDVYYIWMIIAACLMYVAVIAMFAIVFRDVTRIKDEHMRGDTVIAIFTPMVIGTLAMVGMFFPRSNPAAYTLSLMYMMFAYWRCFCLFISLFGDVNHMSDIMIKADVSLKTNNFPFCFFCCLPTVKARLWTINFYKWMVLHTLPTRIIIQASIDVIRTEGLCDSTPETKILKYLDLVTTFVSLWGSSGFVKSSVALVGKYQVENIFRIVNMTQGIFSVQRFILEMMSMYPNVFPDLYFELDEKTHVLEVLEARVQADFWWNVLMIFWLLPISVLMLYFVRPGKCALFDIPAFPFSHLDRHGNAITRNPAYSNSIYALEEEEEKRRLTNGGTATMQVKVENEWEA